LCVVKTSPTAIKLSKAHPGTVVTVQVTDAAAVDACCKFADDQRCLVEPACGAALAAGSYDPIAVSKGLVSVLDSINPSDTEKNIVIVACGGNCVNRSLMEQWKEQHLVSECMSTKESE
jgi:L-serine/L-threonine ammonia-lyase